jgi:hypothetical protein
MSRTLIAGLNLAAYCILAELWRYGSMAKKKAKKKPSKKKLAPKPDINQVVYRIVKESTN